MVQVLETVAELRDACRRARAAGQVVGVVPTMGYLHDGHRSLAQAARTECDFVVVTIFVNPLQFGPNEDLDRYPRDLAGDLAVCASVGVDVVFAPPVSELYPSYPPATTVRVAGLTDVMCGASRPGHFDGVTTIVTKLFAIIGESRAYFGRKDAQQLAVVRRMTSDLELPVTIIGCPIVRDSDGLARSSRNAYLDENQRGVAPSIFSALRAALAQIEAGERDAKVVRAGVVAAIEGHEQLTIDYVDVRDAATLAPIEILDGSVLIAVAVFCGATRLIDNVEITIDGEHVAADLGNGWVPQHS